MDAYERKARLFPVMLAAAPVSILSATLFSSPDWWQGLVAGGGVAALHYFLAQIVRDKGGAVQAAMWLDGGGSPTVRALYSGLAPTGSALMLQRRVVEVATGVQLPAGQPNAGTEEAATYELAVRRLRDRTRGSSFALIRAENANYGFRRNLYGVRGWGLGLAALGVGASLALFFASLLGLMALAPTGALLSAALSAGFWFVWRGSVTPAFVEAASERYAEALLSAAPFLTPWGTSLSASAVDET